MKRVLFLLSILSISLQVNAKEVEVDTFLVKMEAEINAQLILVRGANDDYQRKLENESLIEKIEAVLEYPGVFDYPFSSFQTMSTIKSPDDAFRLFNWNIEDNNGMNKHFCYMVIPNGSKPNQVIKFEEDHITIPPRPENTLTPNHWYGALYYKIIPVKKGSKTLYTVLGYDGASRSTNKKILDVFYFKGKKLRIGYPVFQEAKGSKRVLKRVFFEYSEKATIGVNWNDRLDAIVFDHLVPETPNLEGMYDFYVPDMTYDGYHWAGNLWLYEEDLIAVNDENRRVRRYNPNAEENGIEYIEVKDVWVDPVDGNPNGGGVDATAPVEDIRNTKKKGGKSKKKNKKHRRWFFKKKQKDPRSAIKD
ncbi:hypothetical protein [Crocinitomix algicola]|uniref:hypothetical protein n=1 Tax=Crocinitomix algicola TaxID=1740263 RepID=UPI000871D556|nr:hypothetical protein [Crocinitomix algicola]